MKYMSVWRIAPEQEPAVRKRFEMPEPTIDGLSVIGRWHECGTAKGYTLIETDDPIALSKYHL